VGPPAIHSRDAAIPPPRLFFSHNRCVPNCRSQIEDSTESAFREPGKITNIALVLFQWSTLRLCATGFASVSPNCDLTCAALAEPVAPEFFALTNPSRFLCVSDSGCTRVSPNSHHSQKISDFACTKSAGDVTHVSDRSTPFGLHPVRVADSHGRRFERRSHE
jgi:hypothetical protein